MPDPEPFTEQDLEAAAKPQRGRRSKRDEIAEFLQEHGLDAALLDGETEKAPETFLEMRDELMKLVWQNRASLKGIALVQALKALATLAEANRGEDEAKEAEPLIADLIAGVPGLPKERRDEILKRELAKLDMERDRIHAALVGDLGFGWLADRPIA